MKKIKKYYLRLARKRRRHNYGNYYNNNKKKIKEKLYWEKDNSRCFFCGEYISPAEFKKAELSIHHKKSISEGGDSQIENLALAHTQCHNAFHHI